MVFNAANNVTSASAITNFTFSNTITRAFRALVSVSVTATNPLYSLYEVKAVQKSGGNWVTNTSYIGDNSQFAFTVSTSGQVQYTNNNYAGFTSAIMKFRAEVLTLT